MPWHPEVDRVARRRNGDPTRLRSGIRGFGRDGEGAYGYCLSFLFPRDDALLEYYDRRLESPPPGKGKVPVGCVWSTLEAGRELAVLRCTAATTSMSLLFDSTSARALWADIGWASDAAAVFLDTEREQWELVFPRERILERPDDERYLLDGDGLEDDWHVDADGYYGAALRSAGLPPSLTLEPGEM